MPRSGNRNRPCGATYRGARAGRGQHPGRGTHNALLSLGERCYLEIISPDPEQDGGPWAEGIPDTDQPTLFYWAIAVPDLAALSRQLPNKLTGGRSPKQGARTSPDLGEIRWSMLMPEQTVHRAQLPFLLDWGDSRHPAEVAPRGCSIASVAVQSPHANELQRIFKAMDFAQPVSDADEPGLEVVLKTPNGDCRFSMPSPIPLGLNG